MTSPPFTLESYQALERRVRKGELVAVLARWEFGKQLLAERQANGGKQLPDGRLEEISKAVGRSRPDLHNWVQLAEECPTRDEVAKRLATYGSWSEIVRRGLGRRGLTSGVHGWANEADHLLFEFPKCEAMVKALREVVREMTPEQRSKAERDLGCLQHEVDGLRSDLATVEAQLKSRAA